MERLRHALIVEPTCPIDLVSEARAEIAPLTTDAYRAFVVQLDLGHEQLGVASRALAFLVVCSGRTCGIEARSIRELRRSTGDETHRLARNPR